MRILFVAMADSIHTVRWINQVADEGWDIHLFQAHDAPLHPDLRNLTVHSLTSRRPASMHESVRLAPFWPTPCGAGTLSMLAKKLAPRILDPVRWLARVIRAVKPDVVHSLEIQHAGYLTLAARRHFGASFPPWIVSNWGSDIYLFSRLAQHIERIKAVLHACDFYSCECQRDVEPAKRLGFRGVVLPVTSSAGGIDIPQLERLRTPGATSARRRIVLKGHQNWAGRALVGLRAIELCAEWLEGYRVAVYSPFPEVEVKAELVSGATGIAIDILPRCSHEQMLRLFGNARAYLGLSIADGICTSFLEAMAMGAFPIQSHTACANEWVWEGETGLLVPPEDPHLVAAALKRALTDDELVDRAAVKNFETIRQRLDMRVLGPRVVDLYRRVAAQRAGKSRVSLFRVGVANRAGNEQSLRLSP
jgi:glycosyltransferase involved in cell wall biosynthesis